MSNEITAKYCALTFDDGPSNITPRILDILKSHNCTASFFVIGNRITEEGKHTMRRAVSEGHTIENHSWDHKNLRTMTRDEIFEEYRMNQELITEVIGDAPQFFRAPGLGTNELVFETVPLTLANGSCGSADWNSNPGDPVTSELHARVEGMLKVADDGHIYLMHDCQNNHLTPDALEIVLPELIARGFYFVNLRELFRIKNQPLTPHRNDGWSDVADLN